MRLILLFLSVLIAFSFYPFRSGYGESGIPSSYKIDGVPFYPQRDYYCGPASLASIINYWGGNVTQDEVGERVFRKGLRGSLSIDLLIYAREKGFDADVIKGDIDSLKHEIAKDHPVLVFLNLGFKLLPRWHYLVVYGYDDRKGEVITHSGITEVKRFRYRDFMKKWSATDYWGLVITPHKMDGLSPS